MASGAPPPREPDEASHTLSAPPDLEGLEDRTTVEMDNLRNMVASGSIDHKLTE